jgi:hypothetical protein
MLDQISLKKPIGTVKVCLHVEKENKRIVVNQK